jgi:nicotinate-nucleotide adenylyltransferase
MGGTFDPIHAGHLVAASEALHAFRLDRVIFVPTGQPWQKDFYSDAEDRFLMTLLGTAPDRRFTASRMEIDRVGPTYTVDTMQALREFHGSSVLLFFILGADAALRLGTWHHIDGLADLADIVVVSRPGFNLEALDVRPNWPRLHEIEMPGIDVSSSAIRERVRANRPIDYLVPPDVVTYIREHGLYIRDRARSP